MSPRYAAPGSPRLQQWLLLHGGKSGSEQEDAASLGSKRGRPRSPQTVSEDLAELEIAQAAAASLQPVAEEAQKPGPQSPKKLPIWARPKWKPAKPCSSQPTAQPRAKQLRNPPRKELRDDMVVLSGALSQPPSKGPVFLETASAAQTTSIPAERKAAGRQAWMRGGGGGDTVGSARRYSVAAKTARIGSSVPSSTVPSPPRQKRHVQVAGDAKESELPTTPGRSPRRSIFAHRATAVDASSMVQGGRGGLDPGTGGGNPQTQDALKDGKTKHGGLETRKKKPPSMEDEADEPEQLSKEWRVAQLASQLRVPQDILKQAFTIFEESCQVTRLEQARSKLSRRDSARLTMEDLDSEFDVFKEGALNEQGFGRVLCRITGCQDVSELPQGLLTRSFNDADGDRSRSIKFLEFALWYARHGFMENVLLTNAQREVRTLARKYGLPIIEVEQYKKTFDRVDEDKSGSIEEVEFNKCLDQLIKVPAHCELPASRVKQFWKEADVNQDGSVNFEEFLVFYNRYFRITKNGSATCPFEEYYRGIRRVPVAVERHY
eukprot:TRINITY_DN32610_c0_g1_i1.p1 TRINITY_DN32610_c0_g1~~TRINITY_DN32610_c0_g1_i1.p1  ORF type:complete len:548 (-),score=112.24 TRINITY_DN32610_c0_g1_i1:39-1682(-)